MDDQLLLAHILLYLQLFHLLPTLLLLTNTKFPSLAINIAIFTTFCLSVLIESKELPKSYTTTFYDALTAIQFLSCLKWMGMGLLELNLDGFGTEVGRVIRELGSYALYGDAYPRAEISPSIRILGKMAFGLHVLGYGFAFAFTHTADAEDAAFLLLSMVPVGIVLLAFPLVVDAIKKGEGSDSEDEKPATPIKKNDGDLGKKEKKMVTFVDYDAAIFDAEKAQRKLREELKEEQAEKAALKEQTIAYENLLHSLTGSVGDLTAMIHSISDRIYELEGKSSDDEEIMKAALRRIDKLEGKPHSSKEIMEAVLAQVETYTADLEKDCARRLRQSLIKALAKEQLSFQKTVNAEFDSMASTLQAYRSCVMAANINSKDAVAVASGNDEKVRGLMNAVEAIEEKLNGLGKEENVEGAGKENEKPMEREGQIIKLGTGLNGNDGYF